MRPRCPQTVKDGIRERVSAGQDDHLAGAPPELTPDVRLRGLALACRCHSRRLRRDAGDGPVLPNGTGHDYMRSRSWPYRGRRHTRRSRHSGRQDQHWARQCRRAGNADSVRLSIGSARVAVPAQMGQFCKLELAGRRSSSRHFRCSNTTAWLPLPLVSCPTKRAAVTRLSPTGWHSCRFPLVRRQGGL